MNNPNAIYDVVFLFGGINDARCETPIGQLSTDGTYDANTFMGALEELIEYAKKEYPNSEIAYLIPYKTTYAENSYGGLVDRRDDYTNAIIAVCEKWGVPYLDMYNSEMISGVLNGTYEITTTDVSMGFNNLSNHDGLHLNYGGYYFVSVFVSQMAEKLILGQYQYEVITEKINATCAEDGSTIKYNFATGSLELHTIAATGLHTYTDDFDCTTALNCDVCKEVLIEAINHIESVNVSYAMGYNNVGSKTVICTNAGCAYSLTENSPALFTCLGYSAPEYGNGGMLMSFTVNKNAISAYIDATGKTLSYGLFAGLDTKLGTNEAVSKDGVAQNGAVSVDFTTRNYDIMEIKVVGFETTAHKEAQVILGAYVIETNGDEKTVSYLQNGEIAEGEKYVSMSYNDLVTTE